MTGAKSILAKGFTDIHTGRGTHAPIMAGKRPAENPSTRVRIHSNSFHVTGYQ
jgi:hypothetical protein